MLIFFLYSNAVMPNYPGSLMAFGHEISKEMKNTARYEKKTSHDVKTHTHNTELKKPPCSNFLTFLIFIEIRGAKLLKI